MKHEWVDESVANGVREALRSASQYRQIHPPTHVSYFSRETITKLAKRQGYETSRIETASYYHTMRNVLSMLQGRGGMLGPLAGVALSILGTRFTERLGFWMNLRDTMFVACRKTDCSAS